MKTGSKPKLETHGRHLSLAFLKELMQNAVQEHLHAKQLHRSQQ